VRNRIYEQVFDAQWVAAHMPDAELRRQRLAFRRGLVRAAAVASLIVPGMIMSRRGACFDGERQTGSCSGHTTTWW
jgi:hypothetical protein